MQEYIKTYLDTAQQLAALKSQESEIAAQIKQLQTIQDSLINDYLEPYYLTELKAAKDAKLQTTQGEVHFKTKRSTTLIVVNEQDLINELRALNHPELIKTTTKHTPNKAAIKKDACLISQLKNAQLQSNLNLSLYIKQS